MILACQELDEFVEGAADDGEEIVGDVEQEEEQVPLDEAAHQGPQLPILRRVWRGKGIDIHREDDPTFGVVGRLTCWGSSASMSCKLGHAKCSLAVKVGADSDQIIMEWLAKGIGKSRDDHIADAKHKSLSPVPIFIHAPQDFF